MIVMYHHVHDGDYSLAKLGHFPFLAFANQMCWVKRNNLKIKSNGGTDTEISLTFDDGLKSHVQYVMPLLNELSLNARFFVQTQPLIEGKACVVHLCQYLVSSVDQATTWKELRQMPETFDWCQNVSETYRNQSGSQEAKWIKTLMNYELSPKVSRDILLFLVNKYTQFDEEEFVSKLYMNKRELKNLRAKGFDVLPHFHSHTLLPMLSDEDLMNEFELSIGYFEEEFDCEIKEVCVPYGGVKSWDLRCHQITCERHISSVVTVAKITDICPVPSTKVTYSPRVDCSQLPYADYEEG